MLLVFVLDFLGSPKEQYYSVFEKSGKEFSLRFQLVKREGWEEASTGIQDLTVVPGSGGAQAVHPKCGQ